MWVFSVILVFSGPVTPLRCSHCREQILFLKGNSLFAEAEPLSAYGIPVFEGGTGRESQVPAYPPRCQSRLRWPECGCAGVCPLLHPCVLLVAPPASSMMLMRFLQRATKLSVADGRRLGFGFSCSTVVFLQKRANQRAAFLGFISTKPHVNLKKSFSSDPPLIINSTSSIFSETKANRYPASSLCPSPAVGIFFFFNTEEVF